MRDSNLPKRRQRIRKSLLIISFLLFPLTIFYFSPALIMEAAAQGIINGSFMVFGLLFGSGLALGRGGCAWGCPGGGLGEICQMAGGPRVPAKGDWIKYAIWAPCLAANIWLAVQAGGFSRVAPLVPHLARHPPAQRPQLCGVFLLCGPDRLCGLAPRTPWILPSCLLDGSVHGAGHKAAATRGQARPAPGDPKGRMPCLRLLPGAMP